MIRVFLADSQDNERFALRLFLSDLKMLIVGEAMDWMTTLAKAPSTLPGMLVVDWALLPPDPLAALQEFRLACLTVVVIVLVSHSSARRQAALSSGADYFISKGEMPDRIAERLKAAAARAPS